MSFFVLGTRPRSIETGHSDELGRQGGPTKVRCIRQEGETDGDRERVSDIIEKSRQATLGDHKSDRGGIP